MPKVKNWGVFEFFNKSEFACKHCGRSEMELEFVIQLEKARNQAGVPFKITSGYRCLEHNEAVGGVPNSSHTRGWAADISCETDETRFKIVQALTDHFGRVGVAENFIHVDMDPEKNPERMWGYWS